MANIFEYKPILQYILEDIDTIDNLPDKEKLLGEVEPYIRNNIADVVASASELRDLAAEVKDMMEEALRDVSIPFDKTILDDITKDSLNGYTDSSRLINDGYLTFNLYKQVVDKDEFRLITDAWDDYHAGMNGMLEAELYPYVNTVLQYVDDMNSIIRDTILYSIKDAGTSSNTDRLREYELLDIEKYMHLKDQLEKAGEESNVDKMVELQKQIDSKDHALTYKKNLAITTKMFLAELNNMVQKMYSSLSAGSRLIYKDAISSQVDEIKSNVKGNDASLKAILYAGFRKQCKDLINNRKNLKNVLPNQVKYAIIREVVKNTRTYLDVALPTIIDLSYISSSESINGSADALVSGLTQMAKEYDDSMLSLSNLLNSDSYMMNDNTRQAYEKDKIRAMYKSL